MSDVKLETAILGLNEGGHLLIEAASRQEHLRISAVAGKDAIAVEKIASDYGCRAYDDYRQLVIQNQPDCLLVAAPIHSCDEYVRTAMKRGSNVLKLAPPARDFEEAAEFVRLAEHEGVQFAVANPMRFAPSFLSMREALAAGEIEGVFLIEAYCWIGEQPETPWRGDPKLAGGGVLLHECYDVIDQIMWNFPLPQHVYALKTSQAHDKQQRLYLTEDTAVVTMKFGDVLIANVIVSRRREPGPKRRLIRLHGKDKTLTVDDLSMNTGDATKDFSGEQALCPERNLAGRKQTTQQWSGESAKHGGNRIRIPFGQNDHA